MIVEAVVALPFLITAMVGMVSYGIWLMAAHSVQEAADNAANAALAGLDSSERDSLVMRSLAQDVLIAGTVDPELLAVTTELNGDYYTVKIRYDVARSGVFAGGAIPLPDDVIERSAVVRLTPS